MERPTLQSALELSAKAPPLEGVPTGVKGLDELFFALDPKTLKPRPLGGFPRGAAVHVTGVSDTGKSLLAEQFALKQAERGEAVLFVTTEAPAPLLVQGLKLRAWALGLKEKVLERILIADAATHAVLREDLPTLFATLEEGLKQGDPALGGGLPHRPLRGQGDRRPSGGAPGLRLQQAAPAHRRDGVPKAVRPRGALRRGRRGGMR
jgi:hypothetical protein